MKTRAIQRNHPKPPTNNFPIESEAPLVPRPGSGIGRRAREPAEVPTDSELVLVWGGLAALILHVVDDNFIQPEPGTSATEHWASGLVPFLVIVAGGFLYPRVRAGLRAAIALVFGVFALVAGAEAAYYMTHGGMSGDDYTGLLSAVAGVLLLAVGANVLWRSRRTHGSRACRYLRRLLHVGLAVVVVSVLLFPIALAYVVTHVARADVPQAALGAQHEDVEFTTSDGLRLEGWFVPSRNGATVIVFPGRSGPQKQARMLIRHGYGVLLFDRRGEGASEGDPNMFGWAGERDLHAAVQYLRSRLDVDPDRVAGIGLSVGGEMLIRAAADSEALKAVVIEGASGQSVRDGLANGDRFDAFLGGAVNTAAVAVFTNSLPPPSLKSQVSEIAPNHVFLIYGALGQGGTEKSPNLQFYAEAREPKQIWQVPEGQHIAGITTQPEEYERRVIDFLDAALLPGR